MDAAVGRVLDELDRLDLTGNTWLIFMGDNGWMLGEHGMTSKVLPYEESMRVPMAIAGPATVGRVADDLVLNIDLTATIYELAGLLIPRIASRSQPAAHCGRAKLPRIGEKVFCMRLRRPNWAASRCGRSETSAGSISKRKSVMTKSLWSFTTCSAIRIEKSNLAGRPTSNPTCVQLAAELNEQRDRISQSSRALSTSTRFGSERAAENDPIRTDIHISGIYPHLTTYGIYSQNGGHYKEGHDECGIGAIVPWAGKLWMVNYAPHMPKGSEHKLFSVDPDLSKPMTVHPESVGGTPAGRMIHKESNQLLIAHYLIDAKGNVRTISPNEMPIRVTAIARHLYRSDQHGVLHRHGRIHLGSQRSHPGGQAFVQETGPRLARQRGATRRKDDLSFPTTANFTSATTTMCSSAAKRRPKKNAACWPNSTARIGRLLNVDSSPKSRAPAESPAAATVTIRFGRWAGIAAACD